MRVRVRNYIWRKAATRAWLDEHEPTLQEKTGGTHAVIETPTRTRLEIEFFCETVAIAEELKGLFGGSFRELSKDWEAQWFVAHRTKPLRIGKRLLVVSEATEKRQPNCLIIPASVAFGTGEHATTAMSLRILERLTRGRPDGWRMLDAGTGSGILALAGRRFGARDVIAIDNDPMAIKTAKWNARENGIRGVKFIVRDITRAITGRFDLITANLYSELLQRTLPGFRKSLASDGWLILSGVLRTQEHDLLASLHGSGFAVSEARRRGKWIALAAFPSRAHAHNRARNRNLGPSITSTSTIMSTSRNRKTRLTPPTRKSTFPVP